MQNGIQERYRFGLSVPLRLRTPFSAARSQTTGSVDPESLSTLRNIQQSCDDSHVPRAPLPIDASLPDVRAALASHRAAVVVAPPGTGKTTRVPPAVADAGRVVVLQPRRVAARSVARRIADEQGWSLGREVGWHVRFDRRFSADTRVLIVTEGMLTHYLDEDPLLTDVSTVILDEFHERSLHTDLGLALVTEAWRARRDLRVIVMSATMDPLPVQAYLDGCPLVAISSATHPLDVIHASDETVVTILPVVLASGPGDVLCFLPARARSSARCRTHAGSASATTSTCCRCTDRSARTRRIARCCRVHGAAW
jgi:HrpA-like RNA helicase